jgi:beta-phosphoglucomutase
MAASAIKAFLFDMNGTMIDDMHYHLKVWHRILTEELGADMTEEEVKHQMYGKNEELLMRVFGDRFSWEEATEISYHKELAYQALYKPHLSLLPGLDTFLKKAYEQNIPMAIGSAASPFNIDFVLNNLQIRHYFKSIVSAADVAESKPDPTVFLTAAANLGVAPHECLVFEDVPKGVEAALRGGMKSVVLTTMHTPDEFAAYPNIIRFAPDYTSLIDLIPVS